MTVFPALSALRLAQDTVERYVLKGELPEIPSPLPAMLHLQRACYVTIYENPGRRLRAMYGTPLPTQATLAQEIIMNTVTAINSYLRGGSIRRGDLASFSYSVAILGPLERVSSEKHLNPALYGLHLVSDTNKSVTILPQRSGIETGQEQLSTAWREADIHPGEAVTMYRFSVSHID